MHLLESGEPGNLDNEGIFDVALDVFSDQKGV